MRGVRLLVAAALFLLACGAFAIVQAAIGELLPHDAAYLGMTAPELCALHDCRILHFMIHDRISFGGVLIAIGVLYLWLTLFPLRDRQAWAWWTLAASGGTGFLSFLAYLGYGYIDTWHGAATLALLPLFVGGLFRTRGLRQRHEPAMLNPRAAASIGRALLLLAGIGITAGGATILAVGMTTVFVPQDLAFIVVTRQALAMFNPHLVPLIAHDRAGFGGALVSFGVAMCASVWWGRPSPALHCTLAVAGIAGFGCAVGIHPVIGYTDVTHLAPAVVGCIVFASGLGLAFWHRCNVTVPSGIETTHFRVTDHKQV